MKHLYKERWEKLLTPWRWGTNEPCLMDPERSPFLSDFDRIIFSSSYRRLGKKTQVHPLTRNDHIHNRLSHSQEVSSVGRSLGIKIGQFLKERNELSENFSPYDIGTIVQSAALIHDIGNPPFGHAGEEAIRDWFKDSGNDNYLKEILTERQRSDFRIFDGNAQGFRVINSVEMYRDDGGMRLTFPTIASMVKYPWSAHSALGKDKAKFNFYISEESYFDKIFSIQGLKENHTYIRHPLSYLTEAADDICYRIIDMEDARELKIINFDKIKEVCAPIYNNLGLDEDYLNKLDSDRRKSGYLRAKLISYLINEVIDAFVINYEKIMNGEIGDIKSECKEDVRNYFKNAKSIFNDIIMMDPTKTALEIGSYSLYKRLLDTFIPTAYKFFINQPLIYKERRALDLMGVNAPKKDDDLYTSYRRVIDFISGMTDDYATFVSRQFSGTSDN